MAARKQSSARLSKLAGRVLEGYEPTRKEIVSLAASVLSQDEVEGDGKPKGKTRN